eukprot:m.759248 g.759248  ORF g.759248 m.759248 type:complete len:149 (+) comp23194_c0_seq33:422-868(+)
MFLCVCRYQVICIASGSPINGTDPAAVAQWDLFEQARTLRKLNPKVKLLLYENADFGVIGVGTDQIQQHPEWWLRDDNGNPYMDPKRPDTPMCFDYRNAEARRWWVTTVTQAAGDTATLFDGMLIDGANPQQSTSTNGPCLHDAACIH